MPEREGLAESDSIPVTREELHRMGLRPPRWHRDCTTEEVPSDRFVGRLSFDLKPLNQVLDEMKARGEYPVSMRLVRKRKPS